STSGARGLKGRCRRGCGPLGSVVHAIGGCRKHTYSTSPLPRPSMWSGSWRGLTNDHGPRPASHALRHSRQLTPVGQARQLSEGLASPAEYNLSVADSFFSFLLQK